MCARRIRAAKGIIRDLPDDHPQNPNHPSQRANFLALMRELGRMAAAQEWERLHGSEDKDGETKGSGGLRKVLKRSSKRTVD
jgi:hypothetical protein